MQRVDYKSTSSDLGPCGEYLLFTIQFLCTGGTRQMQGKTAALPSHGSLQSALSLIYLQFPCKLLQKPFIHFANMLFKSNIYNLNIKQHLNSKTMARIFYLHYYSYRSETHRPWRQCWNESIFSNARINHKYNV